VLSLSPQSDFAVMKMARISIRDLSDDLHARLTRMATENQRSLEGEIRYGLTQYAQSGSQLPNAPVSQREIWQSEVGLRLTKLFERLREDDVFTWKHPGDLPSVAMELGEESPVNLMDYVDGRVGLPFEVAGRIADRFSCSLQWLVSGRGSMFPYSEIGNSYGDFFAPILNDKKKTIKLVRICSKKLEDGSPGRHDGVLLLFLEDGTSKINSGYCGRFYLRDGMGAGGHGYYEHFIRFLNENKNSCFSDYNFTGTVDEKGLWDHHPNFYLRSSSRAHWLMPMLEGRSPGNIEWFDESLL